MRQIINLTKIYTYKFTLKLLISVTKITASTQKPVQVGNIMLEQRMNGRSSNVTLPTLGLCSPGEGKERKNVL